MKSSRRLLRFPLFAGLTAFALAACAAPQSTRSSLIDTTGWTTHCFGRFLIDLPAQAQVNESYEIEGAQIRKMPAMNPAGIAAILDLRENELRAAPHRIRGSLFIRRVEFQHGSAGLLSWELPYSVEGMLLETYLVSENGSVYFQRSEVSPQLERSAIQFDNALSSAVHSLEPGQLPPKGRQAFCIEDAYLEGNEFRSESMNITVRLPEHPGMVFTLFSTTQGEVEPTMLKRMEGDGIGKLLGVFDGVDVLKKGRRDVNGLDAEEHLIAATERGKRGYVFNWEAQGRAESVAAPLLSADLAVVSTRDDSPPAFTSDAQAVQLWDALIGSIRPLPGSRDAPPPAPHEPPPPVESFEQREFNRRSMDHFLSTGTWLPNRSIPLGRPSSRPENAHPTPAPPTISRSPVSGRPHRRLRGDTEESAGWLTKPGQGVGQLAGRASRMVRVR